MRKSLLKTMVGTVLAVSAIAVGSVSVFAFSDTLSEDAKTRTWDFSSNTGSIAKDYAAGTAAEIGDSGILVPASSGAKITVAASYVQFRSGAKLDVPVPANSKGSITIYGNGNAGRTVTTEDGVEIDNVSAGDTQDFTSTSAADGYITLTSNSDYKFKKIQITLTDGSTYQTTVKYNITGSVSGLDAGKAFTITNGTDSYEAIVKEDGTSFEVSSTEDYASGTYTASATNYNVSYGSGTGFTLTGTSPNYTASTSVTFTKKEMGILSAGVYTAADIDAGLPNFDATAITFKSGTAFAGGKVNGTLKFKLDKAATVIISAKTGGSNAGTITIGNANSDSITDKSNFTNYFFENVAAGEVEVVFSGDSGVVVSTITVAGNIADTLVASPKGGDYYCIDATSTYIIHPVSETELEYTSLAMSKGGAAVEATKTTEVYTSVQFADGSTVSAEDCGATYIYAVQVTGTNGAAPTTKYVWVDAN